MTSPESKIKNQRLLAFDIGSKKIGLAIWNPASRLVTPLEIRLRKTLAEDIKHFKNLVDQENIHGLVVGIPLSLSGNETPSTENARFWVEKLKESIGLEVYTIDESLSTQGADDIMRITTRKTKMKEKRDSIAAALILEEFINGLAE